MRLYSEANAVKLLCLKLIIFNTNLVVSEEDS